MSINGLVGRPGHGKSYSAIELFILQALKEKRTVVTNIPLLPKLTDQYSDAVIMDIDLADMAKPENRHKWRELPASAVYVLDELWRIWPAGLKAKDLPEEQLAFIKEHRHNIDDTGREPDIILVTQDLSDIAVSIRNMVETTIICTKLTAIGAKNNFRRDYYQGAIKGFLGPKTTFIRSDQCKYSEAIFSLYKSHTKSTASGAVDINNSGVLNVSVFNGVGFKLGLGLLLFLIVGVIYGFNKTSSGVDAMVNKKTPASSVPVSHSELPQKPITSPVPVESKTWRLTGMVEIPQNNKKLVLISNGVNTVRLDFYASHCQKQVEITCIYNNEMVSRWSGHAEQLRLTGGYFDKS